jgi:hypothetical protein
VVAVYLKMTAHSVMVECFEALSAINRQQMLVLRKVDFEGLITFHRCFVSSTDKNKLTAKKVVQNTIYELQLKTNACIV